MARFVIENSATTLFESHWLWLVVSSFQDGGSHPRRLAFWNKERVSSPPLCVLVKCIDFTI